MDQQEKRTICFSCNSLAQDLPAITTSNTKPSDEPRNPDVPETVITRMPPDEQPRFIILGGPMICLPPGIETTIRMEFWFNPVHLDMECGVFDMRFEEEKNLPTNPFNNPVLPAVGSIANKKFSFNLMDKANPGTCLKLKTDYWLINNHVIMTVVLEHTDGEEFWLWNPRLIDIIIDVHLHHNEHLKRAFTVEQRTHHYGPNNAKKSSSKDGRQHDVQSMMLLLRLPSGSTEQSAREFVETWAYCIQVLVCQPSIFQWYLKCAKKDSEDMPMAIENNYEQLLVGFETMEHSIERRYNLDYTFLDDIIYLHMGDLYSEESCMDWSEEAKHFAYQDGLPENRFGDWGPKQWMEVMLDYTFNDEIINQDKSDG